MTIYLIGLEAWRRGLEVSFVNTDVENHDYQLIISNKNKRIRFSGSRSNLVDKEIINFCSNKYKTREFLKKNDVPVLNCHLIQKDTTELEIEQCAEDIGYPLTVKPNNGNGGEGVILNLKNKEELLSAITRAKNASGESKILLEKYIPK